MMKKKILCLFLAGLGAIMLAGCAGGAGSEGQGVEKEESGEGNTAKSSGDEKDEKENDREESAKEDAVTMESLSKSIGEADMRLSKELLGSGENVVYSPYSILTALMMLDNAESGKAKEEIETLFGVKQLSGFNEAFRAYRQSLAEADVTLTGADSLWLSDKTVWAEESKAYEDTLAAYYDSEIQKVDFTDAAAVKKVNKWISDHTEGMIEDMLFGIPADTRMMLTDAVYFDGKWQTPFKPEQTEKQPFYGTKGENSVDTMFLYNEEIKYQSGDGILSVQLPYGEAGEEARFVMDIFMVEEGGQTDIEKWYQELSVSEKQEVFSKLTEMEYGERADILTLPKFEFEYFVDDMDACLQRLGLVSMYDAGYLTGLSGELAVTNVQHKAKITVDEKGTKAAAATTVMTNEMAAMPLGVEIRIDHPFVFVILDVQKNVILFTGSVQNL